jgi:hypothetical protein
MLASSSTGRLFRRGGYERVEVGAKIKEPIKRKTWLIENPEGRRSRFRHPSGQQSKRAVPLPNNQMVHASLALAANRDNNLAATWMERIKDPYFNRRTPGIMTLARPAPVRATSHRGSAWQRARRASRSASPPPAPSCTS